MQRCYLQHIRHNKRIECDNMWDAVQRFYKFKVGKDGIRPWHIVIFTDYGR